MMNGEIWWIDFGLPVGSGVGFRRPAIVIQSDLLNSSALRTTVVIPLTTNLELKDCFPNVLIGKNESGLKKDSVAMVHLISSIDNDLFLEKVCKLNNTCMNKLREAVFSLMEN